MRYAIFGAGGFGREVAPVWEEALGACGIRQRVSFVSDFPEPLLNGRELLGLDALNPKDQLVIAVADCVARRRIAERCEAAGLSFGSLLALSHTIHDESVVGPGAILCDHTIITSNASIGRHFHLNINSYVAHDCRIGDFVTFAPNVCCNGGVTIDDDVYIGTGALLKPGITIGKGAVIGMGAVVTKDIAPGATAVGNPARPL